MSYQYKDREEKRTQCIIISHRCGCQTTQHTLRIQPPRAYVVQFPVAHVVSHLLSRFLYRFYEL